MSIPPLPPIPGYAAPPCPDGYTYNPATGMCDPNNPPPVNTADPTIRQTITDLADRNFDPSQYYKVAMQGVKDSGLIERIVVAFLRGAIRLLAPMIEEAASLLDDFLAVLAEAFQAAQGQHASGYYRLAAALMTDLLGISVNGDTLFTAFTSQGRQAAMQDLGGVLFDVLAAEFAGVAQTASDGTFAVAKGQGIGGLPAVDLTPEQGMNGARAFLGFASAFAIREGNTDMLASYLPHGVGEMFKDFAEDFSKNLGIGRIGRMVYKPLVTTMVGTPMQQALNKQYRPKLLDVGEAYHALLTGDFTVDQWTEELARNGLSNARRAAVQWLHWHPVDRKSLRILHATGLLSDADYALWSHRSGHTDEVVAAMDQAEDIGVARDAALGAARQFAHEYLIGRIPRTAFDNFLQAVKNKGDGTPLLTPGEVQAYESLPSITLGSPTKHLSLAMLTRDYIDGLIDLQTFSDKAAAMGYSSDDVQLMEQELLVAAKRAQERAAKAAASAARGLLAKLTVAQMETAFTEGLITLPAVQAELTTRGYAPDAVDTLTQEFLVKAKLRTPGTPTA